MKQIILYISLLLFSGLILPFYCHKGIKNVLSTKTKQAVKFIKRDTVQSMPPEFSVYQDIAEAVFPILKNKKIL